MFANRNKGGEPVLKNDAYDYSRLRGDIKAKFKTEGEFSKSMGFISQNSLSDRFNGKVEWKRSEMIKACKLLDKPLEEVNLYFF